MGEIRQHSVRESAVVFLFGLYSVPSGTALALSILFGVSLMIAAAPGALVLLAGPRLRDLRPADETVTDREGQIRGARP